MASLSPPVFRLRVLSLNIWAVPVIGRNWKERIDAIVETIAASEAYDVVCFQEVFLPDAWHRLESQLSILAGLKHSIRFVSGCDLPAQADGAGLAIFSRYPILDSAFAQFGACGRPHRVDQFDYQAGKGIGLARVLLPGDYGTADVYVSHLVAQYVDGPGDEYAAQRVLQALDAAVFIRATRRSDITLLCTDLNAGPDTLVYRMLTTLAGLKDAYSCTHTSEAELAALSSGAPSLGLGGAGHGVDTPDAFLPTTAAAGAAGAGGAGGGSSITSPATAGVPHKRHNRKGAAPAGDGGRAGEEGAGNSSGSAPSSASKTEGGTLTALRDEVAPSNAAPAVARSIYDATFGDESNHFTNNAMNNSAVVLRRVGQFFRFLGLQAQTNTPTCDQNARLDYVLFGSGSSAWPFTPLPVAVAPSATRAWHVVASDIRMREPISLPNGEKINMSDHSGVFAEFACVLLRPAAFLLMPSLQAPAASPMSRAGLISPSPTATAGGVGGSGAELRLKDGDEGPSGIASDVDGTADTSPVRRSTSSVTNSSAGSRSAAAVDPQGAFEAALRAAGVQPRRVAGLPFGLEAEEEEGRREAAEYATGLQTSPTGSMSRSTGRGGVPTLGSTVLARDGTGGPLDGSLAHAMSSYLQFLIVPWAETERQAAAEAAAGIGHNSGNFTRSPGASSWAGDGQSASGVGEGGARDGRPASTLRLAQLHTSPFVAQALDAAAAALHVQMSRPNDGPHSGLAAQAGTATAVARGWRPVLREGLATLERGRAQAAALRDRQLKGAVMNLCLAVALLLGATVADTQHTVMALDTLASFIPDTVKTYTPALLYAWLPNQGSADTPCGMDGRADFAFGQPAEGAAQALYGGAAGACVITLLVLGFIALMRIKDKATMINSVVGGVLTLGFMSLWLAYKGGIRGCAVAGAEMAICLAVVQTMAGLMTSPQEIRGFQRAQAQLRILLQRPPAVIA